MPIIAMTAPGDGDRYLAAGMDGYIDKPIRPQELLTALEGATNSGRRAAEGTDPSLRPGGESANEKRCKLG